MAASDVTIRPLRADERADWEPLWKGYQAFYKVVISDETGQYFLTSLPPGVYTLTIYYENKTFSRQNVLIQVGKESVVNVTVDTAASTGKPKGEVITITGTAPIVDQGSTSATTSASARSPYGPRARTSPPGPIASEQPMTLRPFHGPPVTQPTLLTPTTGRSYRRPSSAYDRCHLSP